MKQAVIAIFFIFLIGILPFSLFAQGTFQISFGTSGNDDGYSIRQTSDGGYIAAGSSDGSGAGGQDMLFFRTDAAGNINWANTYGGTAADYARSVQPTTDGGYIIAGTTKSFVNGGSYEDMYLNKIDANGNLQWSNAYGATNYDCGNAVQQTADGGYAIVGTTYVSNYDIRIVKTGNDGTMQWTKSYGGTNIDFGQNFQQTTDGGYIITGLTRSFGAGAEDIYLIRLDSSGGLLWTKTFGNSSAAISERAESVRQTTDGGFIIGGLSGSTGAGGNDAALIKTNSAGVLQWTKVYGGSASEWGHFVTETNSGYLLGGRTWSFPSTTNGFIVKTDAAGNMLWNRVWGNTAASEGIYGVQQTTDGGFIIAGDENGFGAGGVDSYLIKTDANGVSAGCDETSVGIVVTNWTPTVSLSSGGVLTGSSAIQTSAGTVVMPASLTRNICTPALPISFVSFTGKNEGNNNLLQWTTASETNNDYFIIERKDESEWEETGTVKGAGNTNLSNNYKFNDPNVTPGGSEVYYRLKQVDFDGGFTYSKTVTIHLPISDFSISVYPVPANKDLHYKFYSDSDSETNISITDVIGNVIKNEEGRAVKGMNDFNLNINELSQGMYFLRVNSISKQLQIKFVKQ